MISENQRLRIVSALEEGNISSKETLMKMAAKGIQKDNKILVVSCDFLGDCLVGVAIGYDKINGRPAKLFIECTRHDGSIHTLVVDENSWIERFVWDYLVLE